MSDRSSEDPIEFRLRRPGVYAVGSGFGLGAWAFVLSDDWRGGLVAGVACAALVYGGWFKRGPMRRRYLAKRARGDR